MALSRFDLLHALIFQRSFAIDAFHTNTVDKAEFNGHYYCDKAPGTAFVALPSFYISTKLLSTFGMPADTPRGWFWSDWMTVAASVSALSALGVVCLLLWLQGFMPLRIALLCALVIALGSIMFPYSTMLLSHGLVVGLFSMALWWLRLGHGQPSFENTRRRRWQDFAAGAACGLAIACEYDAALVAGGILAVVFATGFRRGCRMVFGSIPPLLLIPFYNWACAGNPFSLPYGHEVVFTQMDTGFYGVRPPDMGNFVHLLFSPERGLFFWTPFLLLAYPGYFFLFSKSRSLFWLCYCVPLLQVLVMSGYYTMGAGSTLGARFLAPILPLLILPAGMAAARARWIAIPLAILSIAAMGGATLVSVQLRAGVADPLFNYYIPELLKGNFTMTLGEALGLRRPWSIVPIIVVVLGSIPYLWWETGNLESAEKGTCSRGNAEQSPK